MHRIAWVLIILASPALAQKDKVFSKKPLVYKEEARDRQFAKTRFAKALKTGTDDPNCVQLLGAMFTVLAEAAPALHSRDANFSIDPALINAVQLQLGTAQGAVQVGNQMVATPAWPALDYLQGMVRRVLIDRRLPDDWLATAEKINEEVEIIDIGKLKMINESLRLIDSAYFTLPMLRERFDIEVVRANSATTTDVEAAFRDVYLDREVAWRDVTLLDTGVNAQKRFVKGKKVPPGMQQLGAILQWTPPDPRAGQILYQANVKPPPPVILYVHLQPRQFTDLEKIPRGKRMLVKGRFWEMNTSVTEVEIKDALLFEDRDFSVGVVLANPEAVTNCPIAVNDLTGVVGGQPGGFKR